MGWWRWTVGNRRQAHLRGAIGGAAEVTGGVITVSLVLWLQPYTLSAVCGYSVIVHAAHSAVLDSIATRCTARLPVTHLPSSENSNIRIKVCIYTGMIACLVACSHMHMWTADRQYWQQHGHFDSHWHLTHVMLRHAHVPHPRLSSHDRGLVHSMSAPAPRAPTRPAETCVAMCYVHV